MVMLFWTARRTRAVQKNMIQAVFLGRTILIVDVA